MIFLAKQEHQKLIYVFNCAFRSLHEGGDRNNGTWVLVCTQSSVRNFRIIVAMRRELGLRLRRIVSTC
ncbi:unnamed protein product [Periconia digitata]|uniref:Uncharacterized protein n=1 Tax=Periconia digitata TaxID=1303443 RepID=A0A9W4U8K3_9PLEO|nr:unnamed protein product [Periconia digitata]